MKTAKTGTSTLKVFSEGLSPEELELRNKYLIMMHILSAMQMTICRELEDLLNKQGIFRHEIRHNHNQVKTLVNKNYRNIFGDQYKAWIDLWVKDYDRIEEIIMTTIKSEWGM